MTPQILDFLARKAAEYKPAGPVLEVGSCDVNGSARSVLGVVDWFGVDLEPGPGVDVVMDGEHVYGLGRVFSTVVCCETLEHCVRPWVVVAAIKAVLRPGGLLWVTTPGFGFHEHKYPVDCYRFGEDAYRLWLFAGMELLTLEALEGPTLAAVGRKP